MRDYLVYMRPRAIPATFVLAATGYALAAPAGASVIHTARDLVILLIVYSVLGWGGANALNSSQDKDTGPVNLLVDPPPMPPRLAWFGVASSALAIPLALLLSRTSALLTTLMFVLSIAYSVRLPGLRWRGKEVGVLDNLINASGCGMLAVLLGASATGEAMTGRVILFGAAFSIAIFGGYPTTQIFQLQEGERYETARNFTSLVGPARALRTSAACFAIHVIVVLALAAPLRGELTLWRAMLVVAWLALVASACVASLRWARAPFDRAYHRMTRQMATMLTSQAALALALWGIA